MSWWTNQSSGVKAAVVAAIILILLFCCSCAIVGGATLIYLNLQPSGNQDNKKGLTKETADEDAGKQKKLAPVLTVFEPKNNATYAQNKITVKGRTQPGCKITINNKEVTCNPDGTFSYQIDLVPGSNTLIIKSTRSGGTSTERKVLVTYTPPAASQPAVNPSTNSGGGGGGGGGNAPEVIEEPGQGAFGPCYNCGGTGAIDELCGACGGLGFFPCDYCGGSGFDEYGNACPDCGGSGLGLFCDACMGSGTISYTCPTCGGSGEIQY